jgi:hypothetical protein
MMPSEELEDVIRNIRPTTSAATDERIMSVVRDVMANRNEQSSVSGLAGGVRRRIIMSSKWTRLVTAAAILIAVVLGMYALTGSIDGTSITLAQVRAAMQEIDWVRIINKGERGTQERWFSFASQIQIGTDETGRIVYCDFNARRQLHWPGEGESIYESSISDSREFAFGSTGPFDLVNTSLQLAHGEDGSTLTRELGTYQGQRVEVWTASRPVINEPESTRTLTVYLDIDRRLPIAATYDHGRPDGTVWRESDIEFEYPETGPADIYEAGVPQSAQIKASSEQQ